MNKATMLPGWKDSLLAQIPLDPGFVIGRICGQEKDGYTVWTDSGKKNARVTGKWMHQSSGPLDFPCVGDWVLAEENGDFAVLNRLLPRTSLLERKSAGLTSLSQGIAANVDVVFLCMSMNENYNLRRLERYLAMVWASGASPIVLLTKQDLCEDALTLITETKSIAPGVPIVIVSDRIDHGYADFDACIQPGRTYAFIGSSGVGKSTIVNHLMKEEITATNDVGKSAKGHHTTTSRQLFLTPFGAVVIDTPGMRELQLDTADLSTTFEDIEVFAADCRFADCTHEQEPGCAVLQAIEDGHLPDSRLRNYRKMQKELEHQERKQRQSEIALARWKRRH